MDDRFAIPTPLERGAGGRGFPASVGSLAEYDAPVDQLTLIALLAQGLTDEAIGRRLGISSRTVRRRVAEIVETLGAKSRFQAGVRAAEAGWLPVGGGARCDRAALLTRDVS